MTTKVTIHTKLDQVELFFNNRNTAEKFLQQTKSSAAFMGSWITHTAIEDVQKKTAKKDSE